MWRPYDWYDRELARELQQLVGGGERLRIFLLWENTTDLTALSRARHASL